MFTTVHSVLEIVLLRLLTLTGILAAKTAKLHADAANAGLNRRSRDLGCLCGPTASKELEARL